MTKDRTVLVEDARRGQLKTLGQFIHTNRKLAQLSLRELAALSDLSNAYLSQLERGLHAPSIHVIKALAHALKVPAETLLERAGVLDREERAEVDGASGAVRAGIRADPALTPAQKEALLAVYRSFVEEGSPRARTSKRAGKKPQPESRSD